MSVARWRVGMLGVASLVFAAPASVPAVLNAQAWEVLTIEGRRFPPDFRVPVGQLTLLRASGGSLEPIPFQIDERDREGQLTLPEGPVPSQDETPGVFDDNGLLVFAVRDLGERVQVPGAAEIEVADPLTGERGWAYLRLGAGSSAVTRRDVKYDAAADRIDARRYVVSFGLHTTSFFAFVGPDGQPGRNLLDRVKGRGAAHVFWGLLNFHRNENDTTNTVLAWKSGPVRVIRRSRTRLHIGYGLPDVEMTADDIFTADTFEGTAIVHLPFDLRYVAGDLTLRIFLDFDNLKGYQIFSAKQSPVPIACGLPLPKLNGWGADWFGMTGPDGTFVHALRVSPSLRTVQRELYVVADPTPDPPERVPGDCPGVGYTLSHWGGITRGTYRIGMVVHAFEHFTAGEQAVFLYDLDHPLSATVNLQNPAAAEP